MAIPGKHVFVDRVGTIEATIEQAWPKDPRELPRVVFLCHKPAKGGPYREMKLKTRDYPSAEKLNDDVGQIEADFHFASGERKWDRVIIPPTR